MTTEMKTNPIAERNAACTALAILDRAAATIGSGHVSQVMGTVYDGLQQTRESMSDEDWAEFGRYAREHHQLKNFVYQDPFTRRACEKPRGYAGDAVMMDYLYGIHGAQQAAEHASCIGREIYGFIRGSEAPGAVRYRRRHIAQCIDRIAAARAGASVLAVASGHLREAELSEAVLAGHLGRLVALDADAESLREVEAQYGYLGVEAIHGSVRQILARKLRPGTFDFVYAAGLYDYLSDPVAQALTLRLFEMVNPGGQLLIPNFAPQVRDRAYMETFMDWSLIYRGELDMVHVMDQLDPAHVDRHEIYLDPTGAVVYLLVRKRSRVLQ